MERGVDGRSRHDNATISLHRIRSSYQAVIKKIKGMMLSASLSYDKFGPFLVCLLRKEKGK
jgi:hypothetical protein